MTIIIAFDTSGPHCAAALLQDGDIVALRVDPMARGQAEHLMPMLAEVLAGAGLGWGDLDALGVGTGPGNFTGIRIGVAAARGLALGLGIPAVGVTGFAAAAHGVGRPVTIALPAPRDQLYLQSLTDDGAGPATLVPLTARPAGAMAAPAPADTVAAIARIAAARHRDPGLVRPAPFYLRAADAAPPRDPAPLILP